MPKRNKPAKVCAQTGVNDPLEKLLRGYVERYTAGNRAAKVLTDGLRVIGPGLYPLIDHLVFWTPDGTARAREFTAYGYRIDAKLGRLKIPNGAGRVYRKAGYPAILIAECGSRNRDRCMIAGWVGEFGDRELHHVGVRVEEIEKAVFYLEKQGVPFTGKIAGSRESGLRQTVSVAETKNGKPFTVLELIERHGGYTGFVPGEIIRLMGCPEAGSKK